MIMLVCMALKCTDRSRVIDQYFLSDSEIHCGITHLICFGFVSVVESPVHLYDPVIVCTRRVVNLSMVGSVMGDRSLTSNCWT